MASTPYDPKPIDTADRNAAMQTLKATIALGYRIEKAK